MSKLKQKLKKLKSYSRFLRKDYLRNKMPFSFIKMCFVYGIEFGSWQHHIFKTLASNGFKFSPKNGNHFNAKGDEVVVSNESKNLHFNLSLTYPWIAEEVFNANIYKFPKSIYNLLFNGQQKYIVLDMGANRGYASLYFAMQRWCEKIYAFELFPQTAQQAQENFALNPMLQSKITLHKYGLGSKETISKSISGGGDNSNLSTIECSFLPHRDGISSMNDKFLENYAPEESENLTKIKCHIRVASETLQEIFTQNPQARFIVKIDVEGAEYEIMRDIAKYFPQSFERIYCILGDTHCGFVEWLEILRPYDYEVLSAKPTDNGCCEFIMLSRRLIATIGK